MSSEIFDISEIYRYDLPRGSIKPIGVTEWNTSSQNDLVLTPASTPVGYVDIIKQIMFLDKSIAFVNGANPPGSIDIVYPDKDGDAEKTITFNYIEDLKMYAERIFQIGGNDCIVFTFNPAVVLVNSLSKKTLTVRKNSNVVSISSGSLKMTALGWSIKESNF